MRRVSRERGMSLVVAIFLITIIASLTAFALTIGTATRETGNLQLHADRAMAAARAGAEWAASRAVIGGICVANTTFPLTEAALSGFQVTVRCTASSVAPTLVYDIDSFAQWGNFGASNYASRTVIRRVW